MGWTFFWINFFVQPLNEWNKSKRVMLAQIETLRLKPRGELLMSYVSPIIII